ncbi:MAG: NAD(+) synthase [Tannerellaceae bacterium]|nr:NAD(+) synthase [Tannerellaceae bacterium]
MDYGDYGFIKVAAGVPRVSVADCFYNVGQMEKLMREAAGQGVAMMTFPELSVTAYTCQDLFASQTLLNGAEEALLELVHNTSDVDLFAIAGVPLVTENRLINAAVAFLKGEILGVVPKSYIPNCKEYQEQRWFTSAFDLRETRIRIGRNTYPMSNHLLFTGGEVVAGIELCEDLWTPVPPSSLLAMEGANILFNLSASNELTGKHAYRRSLVCQQSARCLSGYVYAMAGYGESTTDLVFAGGGIIAENGIILKESERFQMEDQLVVSEIDLHNLQNDRQVNRSFMHGARHLLPAEPLRVAFSLPTNPAAELTRAIDPHPFVPSGHALAERCEEIFNIQVGGLAKRITHIRARSAVIGVSGGLDSALALLVAARTCDALRLPRRQITGITLPGFGTTHRTYSNAVKLIRALGASFREIPIEKACLQHFQDIGHEASLHDTTYENSQARERMQILMDIANSENGLVVGTGDLSELALGWTTYNGDQMSMYGVNAGIPKTLVRYLVQWIARNETDQKVAAILSDIADTPISPELIPPDRDDTIRQRTEDLVGPYELHDFFLYHFLRFGSTPEKMLYLAQKAFAHRYSREVLRKWLRIFLERFFAQQFKRSCLPDGPKVGSISLSPRGDWRMPSDASPALWLEWS